MSKLVKIMLTSLSLLLILAIAALIVVLNVDGADEEKELTIDEVVKYSYQTPEIITDLQDGSVVRIQFQITTDGKDAHEELGKRDLQLVNILIKELAVMNEDNFKEGLSDLEVTLKDSLNELMTEGRITDVYTTEKFLQ